jgi:hypothetical protein
MDRSAQEHDEVATGTADAGLASAEAPGSFRLSFVLPQFRFKASNGSNLKRQVRAVMHQAMLETKHAIQDAPVGIRIHVQFSTKDFTEQQQADCRTGRKVPPCRVTEVGNLFIDAANGILITDPTRVVQYLCTTGWGENDAVQVSAWEIDLERKEGVQ